MSYGRSYGTKKGIMYASQRNITYLPSSRLNKCLPDTFHTRFTCENDGRYAPGVTTGEISILGNSLYYPFDSSALVYTYNLANPAIPVDGLLPTGLEYLIPTNGVGPYTKYTVLSSTIYITVRLDNPGDIVEISLCPITNQIAVDLSTISSTSLAQQPDAKKMIVTSYKSGYLSKHMNWSTFIGVPKQALKNDLSGNYDGLYSQGPDSLLYWGIKFTTKDGQALAGNMTVNIKTQYNVRLWNDQVGIYPNYVDQG